MPTRCARAVPSGSTGRRTTGSTPAGRQVPPPSTLQPLDVPRMLAGRENGWSNGVGHASVRDARGRGATARTSSRRRIRTTARAWRERASSAAGETGRPSRAGEPSRAQGLLARHPVVQPARHQVGTVAVECALQPHVAGRLDPDRERPGHAGFRMRRRHSFAHDHRRVSSSFHSAMLSRWASRSVGSGPAVPASSGATTSAREPSKFDSATQGRAKSSTWTIFARGTTSSIRAAKVVLPAPPNPSTPIQTVPGAAAARTTSASASS